MPANNAQYCYTYDKQTKKKEPNKYPRLLFQNIKNNDFYLTTRQLKPKVVHKGVQWKEILWPGYYTDIQNRQL